MEKEQAIRFLTEECVYDPPLDAPAAESLWKQAQERAASLPERSAAPPAEAVLTAEEQEHADRFLQRMATIGMPGLKVIKVDPMELVAAQYHVALDRAALYLGRSQSDADWPATALPLSSATPPLEMRFTRRNYDTDIAIDLPHSEFIFGVNMDSAHVDGTSPEPGRSQRGTFGPKELLGHVTALRAGSRLMLGKGYHRIYARIAATDAKYPQRLSLLALDPGAMTAANPQEHENDATFAAGLHILGSRPALIADFFTEGLAVPVRLRKKRYQLQVQARWLALNVE
jgi:hypothetical protein